MTDEMVTLRAPEVRTFPTLEFREFDATASGEYLEGRAVPYNRWADIGWFRERFLPGSFTKSIREAARKLPLLLWHDNNTFPVGVSHERRGWTSCGSSTRVTRWRSRPAGRHARAC